MRLIKTLLMLLAGCFLLACNLLTPQSQPPEGTFDCMGTHNGFYAAAGVITFDEGGAMDFNGTWGTWKYDVDTNELTFEGNRYLASGTYRPDDKFLSLTLKPGEELSHAETGVLNCQPRVE
jgi:hypothetical protein